MRLSDGWLLSAGLLLAAEASLEERDVSWPGGAKAAWRAAAAAFELAARGGHLLAPEAAAMALEAAPPSIGIGPELALAPDLQKQLERARRASAACSERIATRFQEEEAELTVEEEGDDRWQRADEVLDVSLIVIRTAPRLAPIRLGRRSLGRWGSVAAAAARWLHCFIGARGRGSRPFQLRIHFDEVE